MLEESYTIKLSIIGEPKYIGSDIGEVYYSDGSYTKTMILFLTLCIIFWK